MYRRAQLPKAKRTAPFLRYASVLIVLRRGKLNPIKLAPDLLGYEAWALSRHIPGRIKNAGDAPLCRRLQTAENI